MMEAMKQNITSNMEIENESPIEVKITNDYHKQKQKTKQREYYRIDERRLSMLC